MRVGSAFALLLTMLSMTTETALAWSSGGTRIAVRAGGIVVSDGRGGVIVASGYPDPFTTLFALDAEGALTSHWPEAGIELTPGMTVTEHNTIAPVQMVPDGNGGMFLLAAEQTGYTGSGGFLYPVQFFVHHRTASGAVAPGWSATGVRVSEFVIDHNFEVRHLPVMIDDGRGGVIVAWLYNLSIIDFTGASLHLQAINGSGQARWGPTASPCTPAPASPVCPHS